MMRAGDTLLLFTAAALVAATPVFARQKGGAIRVQTNEVVTPVSVMDRNADFVLDLAPADFRVFDDGVPQRIEHCELADAPLSIALVLETSARVAPLGDAVHSAGAVFTQAIMARDGEAALITCGSAAQVRLPFTSDRDAVEKAISTAEFAGSGTTLYDGMAIAVRLLKTRPAERRRILLVIGESSDNGSEDNLRDVLREAETENIAIYAAGLSSTGAALRSGSTPTMRLDKHLPPISAGAPSSNFAGHKVPALDWGSVAFLLLSQGRNAISSNQLEIAAGATGGIHYDARGEKGLESALDQISSELYEQYVLTYKPKSAHAPGFH